MCMKSVRESGVRSVWLIPLLGALLVPKRILPRFWSSESGQDYTKESGGGMPGGG